VDQYGFEFYSCWISCNSDYSNAILIASTFELLMIRFVRFESAQYMNVIGIVRLYPVFDESQSRVDTYPKKRKIMSYNRPEAGYVTAQKPCQTSLNISRYVLPPIGEDIPPLDVAIQDFKAAWERAQDAEGKLRDIMKQNGL
jgi:hypothetical protein